MEAMVRRFGGKYRGTIFGKLVAGATERDGGEICTRVQTFGGSSNEMTMEEQLLGYFFVGLHEGLRDLIRPHDPRDLLTTMERARDVEQVGLVSRMTGGGVASKGGLT